MRWVGGMLALFALAPGFACGGRIDDEAAMADGSLPDAATVPGEAGPGPDAGLAGCRSNADCEGLLIVCVPNPDGTGNHCATCGADSDCTSSATSHCKNERCVGCRDDGDCSGDTPVCDTSTFASCTTSCTTDTDCADAARPICDVERSVCVSCIPDKPCSDPTPTYCHDDGILCADTSGGPRCASRGTLVSTPSGPVRIEDIHVGDLVYSEDGLAFRAVPVLRTTSVAAPAHRVVRVRLETGAVVAMSREHPLADGRAFRDLRAGDAVAGVRVLGVEDVPYRFERTYDILPASSTGTYVAEGLLVGSTLFTR